MALVFKFTFLLCNIEDNTWSFFYFNIFIWSNKKVVSQVSLNFI